MKRAILNNEALITAIAFACLFGCYGGVVVLGLLFTLVARAL